MFFPRKGYIKNTEKLTYGKERQYKLTVTAYDCGKKRATEDVLVKISIKPTCTPGWQGEPPSPALTPALTAGSPRPLTDMSSYPFFGPWAPQDGTTGSSTSLAPAPWPSSQTSTWRRVTHRWPRYRWRWSWRPAT